MKLKVKIQISMDKEETAVMHETLRCVGHKTPEQDRLMLEISRVSEQAKDVLDAYHRL